MERSQRVRLNRSHPISAEGYEYRAGRRIEEHTHSAAQLVHATVGTMRVSTNRGVLVVPPQRAVWIPARTPHAIDVLSDVSMKTVYIWAGSSRRFPKESCVVSVSGLLRHLILSAIEMPDRYRLTGRHRALVQLLFDEIKTVDQEPLVLVNPTDRRIILIADALNRDPADCRSLASWAKAVHASERTIARQFLHDTGITFGQWRQQLRLVRAIEMLAKKIPVSVVATRLGYASMSAFGYMFRRALGRSPKEYFT